MIIFEVGKTYTCRSACDHNCVFEYTVTSRTAKFLFLTNKRGERSRRGVTVWDGVETCTPQGKFSMSPTIYADKPQ